MAWIANAPTLIPVLFGLLVLVTGALVLCIVLVVRRRATRDLVREVMEQSEEERNRQMEALLARIRDAFGRLSLEALTRNNEAFLQLARESLSQHAQAATRELEGKRQLIDQTIEGMRAELRRVVEMVATFEREREKKYGELAEQLKHTAEGTSRLQETAYQLREALSGSRARGQWGERMAEDVLRVAGFQERINYLKQKSVEGGTRRPDFTFLLPQDLRIHMDVKFPFDNYLRFLEAEDAAERARCRDRFLKDVRARIREITTREYIDPANGTLNCVLLFIPNENVYAFIQEEDPAIMDEALKNKVILCSPLTLYAMLAVIRQAVESFNLERMTSQVLAQMTVFQKQWEAFIRSMDRMGKRIEDAQQEFEHLVSTRKNQLEKPLREIERIRREQAVIPPSGGSGPETGSHPAELVAPGGDNTGREAG